LEKPALWKKERGASGSAAGRHSARFSGPLRAEDSSQGPQLNESDGSRRAIQLRPEDNVAVSCSDLQPGTKLHLQSGEVEVVQAVPFGHKVATVAIPAGSTIVKYGQVIGFASRDVEPGTHVHVHNCEVQAFERDYAHATEVPPHPTSTTAATFEGYVRGDGRVGTRNYIAIISTVNCSASTNKYIVREIQQRALLDGYPNVDGVLALTHKTGCGMAFDSPDHQQLARTLAGFARHPNVAAYLIIGLGCEISQASYLVENQKLVQVDGLSSATRGSSQTPSPPLVLTIQDEGGIAGTVAAGVEAVATLLPQVDALQRSTVSASKLVLATECGGSDGNSGVTANPALGVASDLLVAQGGTTILSETPEIYGAEHILTRRAATREVGEALVERIRWWEWYSGLFGAEINNNPTPGNKKGGLTTIYEKSLGAIAKGGSTALRAVYQYAEPVTSPGFVVMDTPGYDPASITGMVAGGANLCVFTTGRGSVFGCKPTPCLKISSNTPMYERMKADMDIDAGRILTGTPVEQVGQEIFDELLAIASGKNTKSEAQGVGEEEFAPWSIGPTL